MDANVDHLIKFYKKSKYVVLDVGGEKFKIQRKILREAINENKQKRLKVAKSVEESFDSTLSAA